MYSTKVLAILLVVSLTGGYASYSGSTGVAVNDPCLAQRNCDFTENILRALDNNRCVLFRNPCFFLNDMCQRRASNQPALKLVNRTKCQENCIQACTMQYAPICAEHNGEQYTFSNACVMAASQCRDDKIYNFVHDGECGSLV
ncbi:U-Kazal-Dg21.2-like [Haematobia irritans]|uniref:U-Kazal-Dg21.2-like n=1 Tax=Haematobia irritans TaxID=7368 RepID=UPI003F4FC9E3